LQSSGLERAQAELVEPRCLRAHEARAALEAGRPAVDGLAGIAQQRNFRTNLIEQWAESGDWELAVPAADEFLAEEGAAVSYDGITGIFIRALLRLGVGDLDGAMADQAAAVARARVAKDPQVLYYSLAVAAHVHADTDRIDEARTHLDELIGSGPGGLRHTGVATGDIAWAATRTGRTDALRHALPDLPWPAFGAARAILDGDFAAAAAIYDAHGAARSAALARLRGGADDGSARAFFARIGATRYAQM
jgi:hypothetical protein